MPKVWLYWNEKKQYIIINHCNIKKNFNREITWVKEISDKPDIILSYRYFSLLNLYLLH